MQNRDGYIVIHKKVDNIENALSVALKSLNKKIFKQKN